MRTSETYHIDELTGRIVVFNSLGNRLRPVALAGFVHVFFLAAFWFSGFGEGLLELNNAAEQEVAFTVETYFEPIVEEEPAVEEETIEETVEAPPPPVEEPPVEEEAEIIEQAPEEEIEKPEPPRTQPEPRLQVEPTQKPKPVLKPKAKIETALAEIKTPPKAAPVAVQLVRTSAPTGFVKPVYPAYLRNPPPAYPKTAKRRRQEGVVELKVTVGADGQVLSINLYKSSGFDALDKAAAQTVRFWRFIAGKRNGVTVASDVIVPIRFSLKSDSD